MWNAHLEDSHFGNSQWNPSLNPKLKFSFSRTFLTLKIKILLTYWDLLAYNWACHFLYWFFAGCSREWVVWPSLQHEPASAAGHGLCKALFNVWSRALGRGGWVPVTLSLCLCKATVLSSPRRKPWGGRPVQKEQAEFQKPTWHSESTEFPCEFLKCEGSSRYWKQCFHGWSLT